MLWILNLFVNATQYDNLGRHKQFVDSINLSQDIRKTKLEIFAGQPFIQIKIMFRISNVVSFYKYEFTQLFCMFDNISCQL